MQHGSNLIGMTDLNVPEQLYQYMVGGHRRTHTGINREKHKSPSYQIKVSMRAEKAIQTTTYYRGWNKTVLLDLFTRSFQKSDIPIKYSLLIIGR